MTPRTTARERENDTGERERENDNENHGERELHREPRREPVDGGPTTKRADRRGTNGERGVREKQKPPWPAFLGGGIRDCGLYGSHGI